MCFFCISFIWPGGKGEGANSPNCQYNETEIRGSLFWVLLLSSLDHAHFKWSYAYYMRILILYRHFNHTTFSRKPNGIGWSTHTQGLLTKFLHQLYSEYFAKSILFRSYFTKICYFASATWYLHLFLRGFLKQTVWDYPKIVNNSKIYVVKALNPLMWHLERGNCKKWPRKMAQNTNKSFP